MSNFVEKKNIFQGMTMAQMKDTYSKMTAKERGEFAGAFVRAAKTAKKPTTQRQQAPKGQQAPKAQKTRATKPKPNAKAKSEAARIASAMKREARILKDKPATGPMKLAAEAKRARILKEKPATGPMKLAAEAKKARKAIEEYEKKKKAKRNRSTMPYAGKFPGEPDKNDKRSQFPRFFK